MDFFSFGKKIFGGSDGDSGDSAFKNPFSMLFEMDRDGDGKITETGKYTTQFVFIIILF